MSQIASGQSGFPDWPLDNLACSIRQRAPFFVRKAACIKDSQLRPEGIDHEEDYKKPLQSDHFSESSLKISTFIRIPIPTFTLTHPY